jgi:hypothetical protein
MVHWGGIRIRSVHTVVAMSERVSGNISDLGRAFQFLEGHFHILVGCKCQFLGYIKDREQVLCWIAQDTPI